MHVHSDFSMCKIWIDLHVASCFVVNSVMAYYRVWMAKLIRAMLSKLFGTLATSIVGHLLCHSYIENFIGNLSVKKFLKLVCICRSCN